MANGAAEAVLLSVLPVLITWQTFSGMAWFQQWPGIALVWVIALVASTFVITLHHLGFRELRGHLILYVILANLAFTLVYLLTMNPLAAVIAHVMMHVPLPSSRLRKLIQGFHFEVEVVFTGIHARRRLRPRLRANRPGGLRPILPSRRIISLSLRAGS